MCVCIRTEVNEHLAKALSHVLWHCQDARYIIVQERVLLLVIQTNKNVLSSFAIRFTMN